MDQDASSGSTDPQATASQASDAPQETQQTASLDQIQTMLKAKDDTSRFVGLALLRSVLDNSEALRNDAETVSVLWACVPPKFLDRLVKTGSSAQSAQAADARNMLDLAVSVIHTFTSLLPDQAKIDKRLVGRLPLLVSGLLRSSGETSRLIVQTILALVVFPEGARVFSEIEDVSPLVEIAPSDPVALEIFAFAYINCMDLAEDRVVLSKKIDSTIQALVSSFKGTDGVTLLEFLGNFLRNSDAKALPSNPTWIKTIINFIKTLLTSRPTPEARNAYTIAAASLLEVYHEDAAKLLFTSDVKDDKPFSYLLITLLLTDTRVTLPRLLELLNDPTYPSVAQRIGSAFDVTTHFVGYLVRSLDDDQSPGAMIMPPDYLLKLRRTISEAMSLAIEFLRDRWDASVAGTFGLHPDARTKETDTSAGKRLTISWESKKDNVHEDPLILAAVRALAIWLREDDNELLRKEAAGLTDMLVDLFKSSSPSGLDFRSPVLVGLEGILVEKAGLEEFSTHGGWQALTADLIAILQHTSTLGDQIEAARGIEIVRVLLPIVEGEDGGAREDWMAYITAVAAWDVPEAEQPLLVQEAQIAALQLATALLVSAHGGMRKRYVHSTSAILGIAARLQRHVGTGHPLKESLDDVLETLDRFR
ncbi:hypotheticall protein [Colletotrichum fructicola]|uniref:Duf1941 family protein n=1 Tax=Colletotrichum fructicola (strain Nara gc5) TaxID=1213859 RepID=L2FYN7_COLFN|nr:uncharacterized protein CGMCC3_g16455 [Colletotrichum fructicola]KAF4484310.1 Uncharacterized protein CGGC5_v007731 [Colletotrichum fructicola Nara gc5]KAE9567371.1 hypothetical protein CGMCC3_g16455 [Colletotrichum fructicola]KAF4416622.1 Uncharacterized protein CFRS1_v003784 [Colletotrichum fructicola]KAF4894773.1 hypotheticall protein [Colletotrichum fructicola]KAF4905112.1 hypotheticall protein [Colletotrichum fructicola]